MLDVRRHLSTSYRLVLKTFARIWIAIAALFSTAVMLGLIFVPDVMNSEVLAEYPTGRRPQDPYWILGLLIYSATLWTVGFKVPLMKLRVPAIGVVILALAYWLSAIAYLAIGGDLRDGVLFALISLPVYGVPLGLALALLVFSRADFEKRSETVAGGA